MQWFYAFGDEQKGPVSEQELQQLLAQGTINAQTLVWREGFAAWQPYGTTMLAPAGVPSVSGGVICAGCGQNFPSSEVIPLAGQMYCANCKPIALQRMQEGLAGSTQGEATRRLYLKHEASVKSVGILYYLGGVASTFIGVSALVLAFSSTAARPKALAFSGLLLGPSQLVVGYGLRRLKPWARIPTMIMSGIGMALTFPLGTIIHAYVLYLVACAKGKMVFSDEYRDVIAKTPHIKYRTSIIIWILLGVIVFAILAALILPLLARMKAGR